MRPLISVESSSTPAGKLKVSPALEPAFLFTGFRGLWMNTSGWSDKASRYFAFEVKRNPGDLKNHVQRILHHISRKDADQLYGAFVDLFRVLKGNGKELKIRLLDNAKPILQPWQKEQLLKAIHHQNSATQNLNSGYAVLSEGISNIQPLIEVGNPDSALDDLASSLSLEVSQASSHQPTDRQLQLEAIILSGSEDDRLHRELTEYYIESGDHDALMSTFSKIEISDPRLLDIWWTAHDKLNLD